MANIVDYLNWRGDLSFTQSHFNEVDNLVLAELSYFNFQNIITTKMPLKEVITNYLSNHDVLSIQKELPLSKDPIPFLKSLQASNRFANLELFHFQNITSKMEAKQFSAISIALNYNTIYVSFKGTDNSLYGWKEDFNLSFMSEIPSQLEAVNYVNKIPYKYKYIILGGHSKGGNLAVYAAANCKKRIQKHIIKVYNNDGPGFLKEFIASKNYQNIVKKINTIVPETSIIGMLLTKNEEYKVVKSEGIGIWQHDALTWQVIQDHFITIKKIDETSTKMNQTVENWLTKVDKEEREQFINTLFDIFDKCQIETVDELANISIRKILNIVKTYNTLEKENKIILGEVLKYLVEEAQKNFGTKSIFEGIKNINKKS